MFVPIKIHCSGKISFVSVTFKDEYILFMLRQNEKRLFRQVTKVNLSFKEYIFIPVEIIMYYDGFHIFWYLRFLFVCFCGVRNSTQDLCMLGECSTLSCIPHFAIVERPVITWAK